MFEDLYIIRFADVLLMHSELTGNADNMNRVRARAGLPAIGYSLEALQQERRHELAFEGQRFQDIRRWHIAETEQTEQYHAKESGRKYRDARWQVCRTLSSHRRILAYSARANSVVRRCTHAKSRLGHSGRALHHLEFRLSNL